MSDSSVLPALPSQSGLADGENSQFDPPAQLDATDNPFPLEDDDYAQIAAAAAAAAAAVGEDGDDGDDHYYRTTTDSQQPITLAGIGKRAAINLLLPFVNGLMLGFGELVAHEIAFALGWTTTKVFPARRTDARQIGPGVEIRPKDKAVQNSTAYNSMNPYT